MEKRSKKGNIAIFVPHAGCKQMCVFCDQRWISGAKRPPTGKEIEQAVLRAVTNPYLRREESEIAFFGGSFTAIPREEMLRYLEQGSALVRHFGLKGIRISTRPDAIDEEILALLQGYGVTAVELGAQSFEDAVLQKSGRGHTAAEIDRAARLVKEAGFELVLQLMTGLPGDDPAGARRSAERAAALAPDAVRLYPCLVLRGTELAELYAAKAYQPQTLSEAVELSKELLLFFRECNIPVIKLGLHASSDFTGAAFVAGPYHPAFRELVEGAVFVDRVVSTVPPGGEELRLSVAPEALSTALGQRRCNVAELRRRLGFERVTIQADAALAGDEFAFERQL